MPSAALKQLDFTYQIHNSCRLIFHWEKLLFPSTTERVGDYECLCKSTQDDLFPFFHVCNSVPNSKTTTEFRCMWHCTHIFSLDLLLTSPLIVTYIGFHPASFFLQSARDKEWDVDLGILFPKQTYWSVANLPLNLHVSQLSMIKCHAHCQLLSWILILS